MPRRASGRLLKKLLTTLDKQPKLCYIILMKNNLRSIDKIDLAATVTVLFWITSVVMVWAMNH